MKTVFTNDMVAHVWAQQSQAHGRSNNGNMFFDGKTIYSYGKHFPMAQFVKRNGKTAVFYNTDTYSISTSQHQSLVSRAIPSEIRVFNLPTKKAGYNTFANDYWGDNKYYLKHFKALIACLEKIALNPSNYKQSQTAIEQGENCIDRGNEFAEFFGLKTRFNWKDLNAIQSRYELNREKAQGVIDRHIKKHRSRVLASVETYRNGGGLYLPYNFDWQMSLDAKLDFYGVSIKASDTIRHNFNSTKNREIQSGQWERERQNRALIESLELPQKINKWRLGQNVRLPYSMENILMRLKSDKEIETSQGATFPIDQAIIAWHCIARCKQNGKGWRNENNRNLPLGHFQIDAITSSGHVKAGCHFVKHSEIAAIAKQLNLV